MNINMKKTKIVIFQERALGTRLDHSKFKHQFYINNKKIEITNSYTYLGEKFSTTGSFKEHKAILKDKAKRSVFATRQHVTFLILNSLYLTIS